SATGPGPSTSIPCRSCPAVPPPRQHPVRYAGVLAAAAKWRPAIGAAFFAVAPPTKASSSACGDNCVCSVAAATAPLVSFQRLLDRRALRAGHLRGDEVEVLAAALLRDLAVGQLGGSELRPQPTLGLDDDEAHRRHEVDQVEIARLARLAAVDP